MSYIYVHAHAVYVLDNMCGLDAQQSLEQEVHVRVSLACIQQCMHIQQSISIRLCAVLFHCIRRAKPDAMFIRR